MDNLTEFQRDLLYIITGSDQPSGQDVSDEITDYYDEEVNNGRLYPNLDTLAEMNLITRGEQDGRTNYYEITDTGLEVIHERREWEEQYVDF
ncbi:PadR family transcriptional regulator [Saliphagus sp. LR7]|uniref:PadR family transcriptional regulator n=1 Tax=Saliphagus sp. LR7 TaxID=2282654 RepID=UPI000DF783E0|nr:PadR family transcriptional regulator [Saliphagus sp. LR7]